MKLNKGEIICPECNGLSYIEYSGYKSIKIHMRCRKCIGEGKVDWIDNIIIHNNYNLNGIIIKNYSDKIVDIPSIVMLSSKGHYYLFDRHIRKLLSNNYIELKKLIDSDQIGIFQNVYGAPEGGNTYNKVLKKILRR